MAAPLTTTGPAPGPRGRPRLTPAMRKVLDAMPADQREEILASRPSAANAPAPPPRPRVSRAMRATPPPDGGTTAAPDGMDPVEFCQSIPQARDRLKAAADLLYDHLAQAQELHELRYALAFAGVDRYWPPAEFAANRRCLARECAGGPLCEGGHAGRGLCLTHLRRYKSGVSWGPDSGLFMDHPPFETKWRKRALDAAGVENWVQQNALDARRWPRADGEGFTADPLQAAPGDRHRWWRYVGLTDTVIEVTATVEQYPDSTAHWAAFGDCHRRTAAIEKIIERLRAARHEALYAAFATAASTGELAALSGMLENTVSKLRGRWRRELQAGPAGHRAVPAAVFSAGHAAP